MSLKLFLILAIVTISVAEVQAQFAIAHVNGTLYCSANGSSPGANGNATPIFQNARVQVVCSPAVVATTPASATTNAKGVYLVVLIPWRNATIDSITASCRIYVLTPLSNCNPTLPPTGLGSNIRFVGARFPRVPLFIRTNYFAPTGFTLRPTTLFIKTLNEYIHTYIYIYER